MKGNRFNIFDVLFYYFLFFVWLGVASSSLNSLESFYAFITSSIFLLSLFYFKRCSWANLDLLNVSDRSLNLILYISICFFLLFYIQSPYSVLQSLTFHALDIDKYDLRVSIISVPLYWVYEGVIKILGCLAIIFALKGGYLKASLGFSIYALFYILSVQKFPIGILLLFAVFVFISLGKLKGKKLFLLPFFVLTVLLYFYSATFKDFKVENLILFYDAIFNRLSVTSELVTFVYNEFITNDLRLGGAILPERLFFILDFTVFSSESVRLPALIMELRGGDFGGANSTFYTEGIAGFGIGFDLLYILIFYFLFFILFYMTKFLNPELRTLCLLVYSLNIINLVNIQMWSILNSCFFAFLFFLLVSCFSKLKVWEK